MYKNACLLMMLFLVPNASEAQPHEIRAYIDNFGETCRQLQTLGAVHQGEYAFIDYIYYPCGKIIDLNREFVRLRKYDQTSWNQQKYVLVHKIKEEIGKSGKIIWHQESDSIEKAHQLLDSYGVQFLFSFSRTGMEFAWQDMRIFVEEIQGLPPSIEIVSNEAQQIKELFEFLHVEIMYDSAAQLAYKMYIHEQN